MSFIFQDKTLLDSLIRHGLEKTAQYVGMGISPQDVNAVRSIIANLEKQISSPNFTSGNRISTESDQPASLTSINLENVGSLVEFLATNKITVDGKRVAYTFAENINDPSYPLYKLEGSAGLLELANRGETVQYGYFINKDLLNKYLVSLQAQLSKTPNPTMQVQVNDIIRQANDQLDVGVGSKYQETRTLPANQILDKLPQNIQASQPLADGNIVLSYGDIAADTALNGWIQRNNITIEGKNFKDQQFDKCVLLTVLDTRAKNRAGNATTTDFKEMFATYQQQLGKLAESMQCQLPGSGSGGAGSGAGGDGRTNLQPASWKGGPGAGGPGGANSPQQLVQILPLQRDQLDFGRIRDFVSRYRDIMMSSTDPNRSQQAMTALDQIEKYMQGATHNTVGQSMTNFSMDGLTANDLVSWAQPPSAGQPTRASGSARALADFLEYVVRTTYIIIKDFYNSHYQQLSDDPRAILAVEQQVGGHNIPFGSSIANSNLNNIATARSRLPQPGVR